MPTMSPDYQLVQLLPLIDSHPKLEHFLKITAHHLLTPPPPHTHTHTHTHTHIWTHTHTTHSTQLYELSSDSKLLCMCMLNKPLLTN